MKKSQAKIFARQMILTGLAGLVLLTAPAFAPAAQAWIPGGDATIAMKMDEVWRMINAIIVGTAKQAAVQAINQQVNFMITGRSTQNALFVTDWQDYLVAQPDQQARIYMNAYIDQITAGRGSLSQYIPANSQGFGLSANYQNGLRAGAQTAVLDPPGPQVTYTGDPSQMFAQGNFRNLSLYLSGINNPWAFNLNVQQKMDQVRQNNQLAAQTQIIAGQGYLGVQKNGQTVTPGSTVAATVANAQDLGNKVIAGAQDIPSVISAVVSKLITSSLTQGIGTMQSMVHKEVTSVHIQTTGQMNASIGTNGPGAQYIPSWQR